MRVLTALAVLLLFSAGSIAQPPQPSAPPRERALENMLQEQVFLRSQCVTAAIGADDQVKQLQQQLADMTKERDNLKAKQEIK